MYSNHLEIDESLLTGESNPIQKKKKMKYYQEVFAYPETDFIKLRKLETTVLPQR